MMDDPSSVIEAQKEQISRYQNRLKDVVAAYKSLLKEKEALDTSIKALVSQQPADNATPSENPDTQNVDASKQMLSSLATLSAEKSRMEAGFQADKKQMRMEMIAKDLKIKELNEKMKALELEKEACKTKLINYDRILSDERHLKENLEFQLQQLKTQFISTHSGASSDLNQENIELRKKLKSYESNSFVQDASMIQALQSEIENLKQQHVTRSQIEQQKANEVNEKSRKLTAVHEKQVSELEQKLSELSLSVSNYHKLREADTEQIAHLKEVVFQLSKNTKQVSESKIQHEDEFSNDSSRLETPIDLTEISIRGVATDPGFVSIEKYVAKKKLCNRLKSDNEALATEIAEKSLHIRTLQEKVSVLNKNIDEYENEIKRKSVELNAIIKAERANYKEAVNSLEMAHRSQISQLEQQIQKQRERSLILLKEKENELRSLKTSYELFLPKKNSVSKADDDDDQRSSKSDSRKTSSSHHLGIVLSQAQASSSNLPETHMIYYSNELARKEIELSSLRKAKREAESLMRQTLKEKISMQEAMDQKIASLEQQVDRLERTKSREGESLEYLKNVVISYLRATDQQASQKVYLLTAIAAVLKFDQNELKLVGLNGKLSEIK